MSRITTFTVTGRGAFPIDMLRYDGAWPCTSEDAHAIADSLDPTIRRREPWTVKLNSNQWSAPTRDRWSSFMCRVTEVL